MCNNINLIISSVASKQHSDTDTTQARAWCLLELTANEHSDWTVTLRYNEIIIDWTVWLRATEASINFKKVNEKTNKEKSNHKEKKTIGLLTGGGTGRKHREREAALLAP